MITIEKEPKKEQKPQKMVSVVVCSICEKYKKTTLRRIKETKGYICNECFKVLPTMHLQHKALEEKIARKQYQESLMRKKEESLIVKPTTNEIINISTGARV